jgi:hypothetical protein
MGVSVVPVYPPQVPAEELTDAFADFADQTLASLAALDTRANCSVPR